MKTLCICTITILLAGAATAAAQTPAEIAKVLADYQTAYSSHDAKASAALYATDGDRRTVDGHVVKGRQAIERQLTADFNGRFKSAVVTFNPDEDVRHVGADMAIVDGSAMLSGVATAAGKSMPPTRFFHTIVLVKRDGAWQILVLRNWAAPNP